MSNYIDFERHDFLTFFDNENIIEKDAGIIKYSIQNKHKMLFSLYLSTYEQYAIVSLKYENEEKYIFEVGLKNISRIICDKQNLYFYKNNHKETTTFAQLDPNLIQPFFVVNVKPTISISVDL